jgi:RES domain-containing protein
MPESSLPLLTTDRTVLVYRLVKERFIDSPLSTEGARRYGGRWNPPGIGILYTSASPELALLEQLVHLPTLPYQDLPRLYLLTLALPVPPSVLQDLSPKWREEAGFQANYKQLASWLRAPEVLAIGVPSAVVPESFNYLLHPLHPDYNRIEIISTSAFNIDPRLWRDENSPSK